MVNMINAGGDDNLDPYATRMNEVTEMGTYRENSQVQKDLTEAPLANDQDDQQIVKEGDDQLKMQSTKGDDSDSDDEVKKKDGAPLMKRIKNCTTSKQFLDEVTQYINLTGM